MAKLYPPYVEGKLPAFVGTTIVVPFSMNRAVSPAEVLGSQGLHLVIKKINRDDKLVSKRSAGQNLYGNCYATFFLTQAEAAKFTLGQYYRVQLAYVGKDGKEGYYSSVGVIKYTAYPEVAIESLDEIATNGHIYDYTGTYRQSPTNGDSTEKMYSSRMILRDSSNRVLYDSGEVVHNTGKDTLPNEASETFRVPCGLSVQEIYKLQWTVTTINGLTVESPIYRLTVGADGGVNYSIVNQLKLVAKSNYEHGTVDLKLYNILEGQQTITGMFLITRTEAKEPYDWQPIRYVIWQQAVLSGISIHDYTVEQGKKYIYAIQQYNNYGVYSVRSYADPISVDFEDYYLLDTDRQLRIRFNPKINSMKNTVVANRVNTIGSKYPHIVRNGVVGYKEFSLAGLLSYHMDEDEDFMSWEALGLERTEDIYRTEKRSWNEENRPSYDLNRANMAAERMFKLEALEWLNNGKPKILKSPAEGNYMVVLMDINFSPEDRVSRMLHTFSCTAIEMAPFDYSTLLDYGFFDASPESVPQFKTILLSDYFPRSSVSGETMYEILPVGTASRHLAIHDMIPGTKIEINGLDYIIPKTGTYLADIKIDEDITSIRIPLTYGQGNNVGAKGQIDYETPGELMTAFDIIHGYTNYFRCGHQFIGTSSPANANSLISNLNNLRDNMLKFIGLRVYRRDVLNIYAYYGDCNGTPTTSINFYYDGNGNQEVDKQQLVTLSNTTYDWNNKATLFKINWINKRTESSAVLSLRDLSYTRELPNGSFITQVEQVYVDSNGTTQYPLYSGYVYDPNSGKVEQDDFELYNVDIEYYDQYKRPQAVTVNVQYNPIYVWDIQFAPYRIRPHAGTIVDLTYIGQTINYAFEDDNPTVNNAYNYYKGLLEIFYKATQTTSSYTYQYQNADGTLSSTQTIRGNCTTEQQRSTRNNQIWTLRSRVKTAYNRFISALATAVAEDTYYRALL